MAGTRGNFEPLSEQVEAVAEDVVDATLKVHRTLGFGLLEKAYQRSLAHELDRRGLDVEREVPVDLTYEELVIEAGYRIDLLVDRSVLVEVKACSTLEPVHTAQALAYLRWSQARLGFLLNFHASTMRDGLKRLIW